MRTLSDLLASDLYDTHRFGASSDDWIDDPDRAERVLAAAEFGAEGSTHGEIIDDWRRILGYAEDVSEEDRERILREIDAVENWHIENGSIDEEIG